MTGTCRISMHCTPIGPAIVIETGGARGYFSGWATTPPGLCTGYWQVRITLKKRNTAEFKIAQSYILCDLTPALKSSVWQVATSQWVAAVKKLLVF
ncbi:unnamed protein product [Allacma fusca]|uniref:Uncharacterized protein n=1 Tax=Allacma fusca TaxID=39272 RepID=A0A8J2LNX7_9HEXA|nr:unnamed protein product [Allacma fusca]